MDRRIYECCWSLDAICLELKFTHNNFYCSLATSLSLSLLTLRSYQALISYLARLWWLGWIHVILVRILHFLPSVARNSSNALLSGDFSLNC